MWLTVKKSVYVCGAVFIIAAFFARPAYCAKNTGFYYEAGPMLLSPVTENIVLTGKEFLEFKWWRVELVWTDHMIFKLYKGYNTTLPNLILKKEAGAFDYPIKIPASQFEENQVYTWVIQQVFTGGRKSDKSFSSFTIIKK